MYQEQPEVVKRGRGRPPKNANTSLKQPVSKFKKHRLKNSQRKRLVGPVRRWQKKWATDSHLDLFKWVVVEGTDDESRWAEPEPVEESDDVEEEMEQEETSSKRTRVARSRSVADIEQPKEIKPAMLIRYKCPECHKLFEKHVGCFAHMRKMHQIQTSTVDADSLRISIEAEKELQLRREQNSDYPCLYINLPVVEEKKEEEQPVVKQELKIKFSLKH